MTKGKQRVKGNAQAASSSKAAIFLENSTNRGDLAYIYTQFSEINENVIDESKVHQEFLIVLKKLYKKDNNTKIKALQDLLQLLSNKTVEDVQTMVAMWAGFYSKTAIDNDKRVRELSHKCLEATILKIKKFITPHLNQIMGPWLLSQCDTYTSCAFIAKKSFEECFPGDKKISALIRFKDDILLYLENILFKISVDSIAESKVCEADEVEGRYIRLLTSALDAFVRFVRLLGNNKKDEIFDQLNSLVFKNKKFWKLQKSQYPSVRRAFFDLITCLLEIHPSFLLASPHLSILISSTFQFLDTEDFSVIQSVWKSLMAVLYYVPDPWVDINMQKAFLPKLWKVLETCSHGNSSFTHPNLVLLLDKLPEKIKSEDTFQTNFFLKSLQGLEKDHLSWKGMKAAVEAFMECVRFMTRWLVEDRQQLEQATNVSYYMIRIIELGIDCDKLERNARLIFEQSWDFIFYLNKMSFSSSFCSSPSSPTAPLPLLEKKKTIWLDVYKNFMTKLITMTTKSLKNVDLDKKKMTSEFFMVSFSSQDKQVSRKLKKSVSFKEVVEEVDLEQEEEVNEQAKILENNENDKEEGEKKLINKTRNIKQMKLPPLEKIEDFKNEKYLLVYQEDVIFGKFINEIIKFTFNQLLTSESDEEGQRVFITLLKHYVNMDLIRELTSFQADSSSSSSSSSSQQEVIQSYLSLLSSLPLPSKNPSFLVGAFFASIESFELEEKVKFIKNFLEKFEVFESVKINKTIDLFSVKILLSVLKFYEHKQESRVLFSSLARDERIVEVERMVAGTYFRGVVQEGHPNNELRDLLLHCIKNFDNFYEVFLVLDEMIGKENQNTRTVQFVCWIFNVLNEEKLVAFLERRFCSMEKLLMEVSLGGLPMDEGVHKEALETFLNTYEILLTKFLSKSGVSIKNFELFQFFLTSVENKINLLNQNPTFSQEIYLKLIDFLEKFSKVSILHVNVKIFLDSVSDYFIPSFTPSNLTQIIRTISMIKCVEVSFEDIILNSEDKKQSFELTQPDVVMERLPSETTNQYLTTLVNCLCFMSFNFLEDPLHLIFYQDLNKSYIKFSSIHLSDEFFLFHIQELVKLKTLDEGNCDEIYFKLWFLLQGLREVIPTKEVSHQVLKLVLELLTGKLFLKSKLKIFFLLFSSRKWKEENINEIKNLVTEKLKTCSEESFNNYLQVANHFTLMEEGRDCLFLNKILSALDQFRTKSPHLFLFDSEYQASLVPFNLQVLKTFKNFVKFNLIQLELKSTAEEPTIQDEPTDEGEEFQVPVQISSIITSVQKNYDSKMWDNVLCACVSWLQAIQNMPKDLVEGGLGVEDEGFVVELLGMVRLLNKYFRTLKISDNSSLVDEWNNVFEVSIIESLILISKRVLPLKGDQVNPKVLEFLLNCLEQLSLIQLKQLVQSKENLILSAEDEEDQLIEVSNSLVEFYYKILEDLILREDPSSLNSCLLVYSIIRRCVSYHTKHLNKITSSVEFNLRGEEEVEQETLKIEDVLPFLIKGVSTSQSKALKFLKQPIKIYETSLNLSEKSSIFFLHYFLYFDLLLNQLIRLNPKLKSLMVQWAKESNLIDHHMKLIFSSTSSPDRNLVTSAFEPLDFKSPPLFLPSTNHHLSFSQLHTLNLLKGRVFKDLIIFNNTSSTSKFSSLCFNKDFIKILSFRTYVRTCHMWPLLLRSWFAQLDSKSSVHVDKFTMSYVSSGFIQKELTSVTESEKTLEEFGENLQVKVSFHLKEVTASYSIDEFNLQLSISFPDNSPLGQLKISADHKRVTSVEQNSHSWLLQLTKLINYQDGSILDALALWRRKLDKHLDGSSCMICFSLIFNHQGNKQLPKHQCKTCKKKFHNYCLFTWFKTSHKNQCPNCRTPFN